MERKELIIAYIAFGFICFFWGTTYLAIRIGVESLPPALFAGFRHFIAGTLFLAFLKLRGVPMPCFKDLRHLAIVGISLLVFGNGVVVWSEQWVPSSLAALVVATVPFWMVGYEAILPTGMKLNARVVTGIIVGFSGLILLLWPDLRGSIDSAYLTGILVLFFAPFAWASGSIYSKYKAIKTHPMTAAAFQMIIGGSVLIMVGAVTGEFSQWHPEPQGLAALAYLTVFGSMLGYSAYIYALGKLPASKVSMYAYINPVIAVFLGWLVLDERLNWQVILATTIILSGVILVNSARTQKRSPSPEISERKTTEQKRVIEGA